MRVPRLVLRLGKVGLVGAFAVAAIVSALIGDPFAVAGAAVGLLLAIAWLLRTGIRDLSLRLASLERRVSSLREGQDATAQRLDLLGAGQAEQDTAFRELTEGVQSLQRRVQASDDTWRANVADLEGRVDRLGERLVTESEASRRRGHDLAAAVADLQEGVAAQAAAAAGVSTDRLAPQNLREFVEGSGLFDGDWYARQHARLLPPEADPLEHYLAVGWQQGLDPSPWLDVDDYRRRVNLGSNREPITDLLARERAGALPPARLRSVPADEVERERRWADVLAGAFRLSRTVALYRIVGNDLPPRHPPGQTRSLVAQILKQEPELEACETWWIVNRIVDPDEEMAIIALLREHGQRYLVRPVRDDGDLGPLSWDARTAREAGELTVAADRSASSRDLERLFSGKITRLIDINGVRNLALRHGWQRATWVLPLDGGCIFTHDGWNEVITGVRHSPGARYLMIPTQRLERSELLSVPGFRPTGYDEPMIAFRCDAIERFDEHRPYGVRDKVALLRKLGVSGPWDRWDWQEDDPGRGSSRDAGRFHVVGWVGRLPSGHGQLDADLSRRGDARAEALVALVDRFETARVAEALEDQGPAFFDVSRLDAWREEPVSDPALPAELAHALDRAAVWKESSSGGLGQDPPELVDVVALAIAARLDGSGRSVATAQQVFDASVSSLLASATGSISRSATVVFALDAALLVPGPHDELVRWCADACSAVLAPGDVGSIDPHAEGLWQDLAHTSIGRFLKDASICRGGVRRIEERLLRLLTAPPEAAPRMRPLSSLSSDELDRLLLLLQGGVQAALVARRLGTDLIDRDLGGGRTLRRVLCDALQSVPPETSRSTPSFAERWSALQLLTFGPVVQEPALGTEHPRGTGSSKDVSSYGLRPYWSLAAPAVLKGQP